MLTKKILSLQHPLIKHWVKLRLERAYREEKNSVLLIGKKTLCDASKNILIHRVISCDEILPISSKERIFVTKEILKKITGLEKPDGFAAEVEMPLPQDLKGKKRILILDGIQDPGNLGTLLRTATALGWEGVIFTPGTVDSFNDKALRASKGSALLLPFCRMDPTEIESFLKENSLKTYLADIQGTPFDQISYPFPLALILSHEGLGPNSWTKNYTRITIPMSHQVESLNVACSGAILLYSMRQK